MHGAESTCSFSREGGTLGHTVMMPCGSSAKVKSLKKDLARSRRWEDRRVRDDRSMCRQPKPKALATSRPGTLSQTFLHYSRHVLGLTGIDISERAWSGSWFCAKLSTISIRRLSHVPDQVRDEDTVRLSRHIARRRCSCCKTSFIIRVRPIHPNLSGTIGLCS